ncbi:MAG: hypothetical protein BRD50_05715 [Bacteroidetes bacterium SW_11_45_7]|nr:MAG: hypothetical protein BRD50_05715 [Bacteroidetes bacterium SW_11_45_7]
MRINFLILVALGWLVVSCNPCSDVVCKNGTKEQDGRDCKCECDEWYEGEECNTRMTKKFEGNYVGDVNCDGSSSSNAPSNVKQSPSIDNRLVFEDGDYYGVLTSSTSFDIPKQSHPDPDIETIRGGGSLNGSQITINAVFTSSFGGQSACTFTGTD